MNNSTKKIRTINTRYKGHALEIQLHKKKWPNGRVSRIWYYCKKGNLIMRAAWRAEQIREDLDDLIASDY